MNKLLLIGSLLGFALAAAGQGSLKYEVDASWPKALPAGWINGQLGGVCVDAHDHVVVVHPK